MQQEFYTNIPVYENGVWTDITFNSQMEFRDYLLTMFKVPGEYEFDETSLNFNELAKLFNTQGFYCVHPEGTKDFRAFWDTEKQKCRKGVFFINGDKKWYLSRDY